jgi:hypothetical protein
MSRENAEPESQGICWSPQLHGRFAYKMTTRNPLTIFEHCERFRGTSVDQSAVACCCKSSVNCSEGRSAVSLRSTSRTSEISLVGMANSQAEASVRLGWWQMVRTCCSDRCETTGRDGSGEIRPRSASSGAVPHSPQTHKQVEGVAVYIFVCSMRHLIAINASPC